VRTDPSRQTELYARSPVRVPLGFLSAANGCLGFGLAGSIGLRKNLTGRPEIAVLGDGSTTYAIQALWSAERYDVGVLLVVLANGRYFAPRVASPVEMHTYGYPKLLFQMRVEYEDGSVQDVVSDTDWKLTTDGPVLANSEYDGEEYDARKEQADWSRPGFDDARWRKAARVDPPGGALEAQTMEPIRVTETPAPIHN